jgi:hypothetical protein
VIKEEAMRWSNLARSALFSVAICCVAMPEAEAIEILAPPALAAHVTDGTVTQVRFAGGGVRRGGGGYRGGGARFAGGAYRGGGARFAGGAYRGRAGYGYRGGARFAGGYGYRGGYGRYGYRGGYGRYGYGRYGYGYGRYGYGYRPYGYGYGYGAAALGAAAIGAAAAANHCWIDSYGARVCNYY